MEQIQSAKQELSKLKSLYIAQINLQNSISVLAQSDAFEERRCALEAESAAISARLTRLFNALCVLDAESRQILLMCYAMDDYVPEDIMDVLHIEKATFYRRKKAALERFADALYGPNDME